MRKLDKRLKNNVMINVKDKLLDDSRGFNPYRKIREGDKPNKDKGVQCHEFEGFGHIQEECTNFLQKQKKGYIATLLDEEFEDDSDEENDNMVVEFIARMPFKPNIHNDGESKDEDLLDEDVTQ